MWASWLSRGKATHALPALIKGFTIVLVLTAILFYTSPYAMQAMHLRVVDPHVGDEADFIDRALATEIDGPFDPEPIRAFCRKQAWFPGLVFQCAAPQGGVSNIRSVFQTCLRFAMEAGAGMVVPKIVARDAKDLSQLTTADLEPFTYMFDTDHLIASLADACPEMPIYRSKKVVPHYQPDGAKLPHLDTLTMSPEIIVAMTMKDPTPWRANFDAWLASNYPGLPTLEQPLVIDIGTPLFQWPTTHDSEAFRNSFPRVFRFRLDARALASKILFEMTSRFKLGLQPDKSGIHPKAYYGAHLRTAADAVNAGFESFEQQSSEYLQHAKREGLKLIYVTSGSRDDIDRFSQKAWDMYKFNVTTKYDLLRGPEREILSSLSWDQQGLVDYEVLLRSSKFGGISQSSFAWNIAMRRHVLAARAGKGKDYLNKQGVALEDEYSKVFGEQGAFGFFPAAMWP